jgi:hypothetical protein
MRGEIAEVWLGNVERASILRDAAKTPLLRIRPGRLG